uniref:G_PROTEIN_RECEP_F1_2 domain-containing protein n=1 Tax=Macrostomum lignano TaxID=282301 RepID=A0A1I8JQM2_9PLAT
CVSARLPYSRPVPRRPIDDRRRRTDVRKRTNAIGQGTPANRGRRRLGRGRQSASRRETRQPEVIEQRKTPYPITPLRPRSKRTRVHDDHGDKLGTRGLTGSRHPRRPVDPVTTCKAIAAAALAMTTTGGPTSFAALRRVRSDCPTAGSSHSETAEPIASQVRGKDPARLERPSPRSSGSLCRRRPPTRRPSRSSIRHPELRPIHKGRRITFRQPTRPHDADSSRHRRAVPRRMPRVMAAESLGGIARPHRPGHLALSQPDLVALTADRTADEVPANLVMTAVSVLVLVPTCFVLVNPSLQPACQAWPFIFSLMEAWPRAALEFFCKHAMIFLYRAAPGPCSRCSYSQSVGALVSRAELSARLCQRLSASGATAASCQWSNSPGGAGVRRSLRSHIRRRLVGRGTTALGEMLSRVRYPFYVIAVLQDPIMLSMFYLSYKEGWTQEVSRGTANKKMSWKTDAKGVLPAYLVLASLSACAFTLDGFWPHYLVVRASTCRGGLGTSRLNGISGQSRDGMLGKGRDGIPEGKIRKFGRGSRKSSGSGQSREGSRENSDGDLGDNREADHRGTSRDGISGKGRLQRPDLHVSRLTQSSLWTARPALPTAGHLLGFTLIGRLLGHLHHCSPVQRPHNILDLGTEPLLWLPRSLWRSCSAVLMAAGSSAFAVRYSAEDLGLIRAAKLTAWLRTEGIDKRDPRIKANLQQLLAAIKESVERIFSATGSVFLLKVLRNELIVRDFVGFAQTIEMLFE